MPNRLLFVLVIVVLAMALKVSGDLGVRNRWPEDRLKRFDSKSELRAACDIPGVCSGPLKVYFASTDCSGSAMSYGCFQDPDVCYPEVAPASASFSKLTCDQTHGLVQSAWSTDATCKTPFDRSKSNPINNCIQDGFQSYFYVCSCDDIGDGANTPDYFEACPVASPYASNCPVFGPCPPTNYWMTTFNDSACTIPMYSYATVPDLPLGSCYSTVDISTNKPTVNHITKCGADGYIYDNFYLGSRSNPYLYETRMTKNSQCIAYNWGYEKHFCKV